MRSAPASRLILAAAMLLLLASLACSVGGLLAGGGPAPVLTPTVSQRPTFTPAPGMGLPTLTIEPAVKGELPPGVVLAPGNTAGGTNLVLVATPTDPGRAARLTASVSRTPTRTPMPTAGPTATAVPTPYAIAGSGVTGRRGPGLEYEAVAQAQPGDEFMILARTQAGTWWQVCCMANQPVWVRADTVSAMNPVDRVPVVAPPPTATPLPTATVGPTPTKAPTPTPPLTPFDIARGPEYPITRDTGIITIWVKVYEGPSDNETALPGYVLKVTRNEIDVSLPELSKPMPFDRTNLRWEGALPYNLKFEMDRAQEAYWSIYLARPDGSRVSPISKFSTMGDSYRNQVIYIAYWLAR